MKRLFKKWKWLEYVEAALLIVLGIIIICFNANPNLHVTIGYIVASYILVNAIILIVAAFAFNFSLLDADFWIGLILLTIAIWLYVYPTTIITSLPLIVGVCLIGGGAILIIKSIIVFMTPLNGVRNILSFIIGLLCSSGGVALIALRYSEAVDVSSFILLIIGLIMLANGIGILINLIYVSYQARKIKKDDNIIDVKIDDK
jgi:hypothetical protein